MTTAIELLRNPRLVADDLDHCFGSGKDACLQWDTAETNDALKLGLKLNDAAFSGNFILVNKDHIDKNTGLGVTPDPRLVVWSGGDPEAGGANEYVSLHHDRTSAVLQSGAGGLIAALADSFPSADPGAFHIWAGSAGAVAANSNSKLVVEGDSATAVEMTFLAPDASRSGIRFGCPTSNIRAHILYYGPSDSPADTMEFATTGGASFRITGGATPTWEGQGATTISTTAGDLTLNPAGRVVLGAHDQEFGEISDPAAPATNSARLYARDNGSGKTQLVVRFPTGAVQVLATEP